MVLFVDCNRPLIDKLNSYADSKQSLDMETEFCSVSLDIIGRWVINYTYTVIYVISIVCIGIVCIMFALL